MVRLLCLRHTLQNKSKSRIIHVLNFTHSNWVRVGRGQEANVRITDISVSRNHAGIEWYVKLFNNF